MKYLNSSKNPLTWGRSSTCDIKNQNLNENKIKYLNSSKNPSTWGRSSTCDMKNQN